MACPCELKPAPLPASLRQAEPPPPPPSPLLPHQPPPRGISTPAPGWPRRKQKAGDTPESGEVRKGGKKLPKLERRRPWLPSLRLCPQLRAWALPALLTPAPSGARALLRADVPPKWPSPLLLPSRCSPFPSPRAAPGLGQTWPKMPFVSDTQRLLRQGDGSWGRRRHFRPRFGHRTAQETMPTSDRRGWTSPRGHLAPGLAGGRRGHPLLSSPHPGGRRRVLPSGPPVRPRWPHKFPAGGVGSPPPCGSSRAGLALCPRALRGAARGGGAGGPGGGGGLTSHCPRRRRRRSGTPAGCGGSCGCGPAWAGSWCA